MGLGSRKVGRHEALLLNAQREDRPVAWNSLVLSGPKRCPLRPLSEGRPAYCRAWPPLCPQRPRGHERARASELYRLRGAPV